MWRLNRHHGAVMEPEEYVDSVRLCLGCAGPCEPVPWAACQTESLDTGAAHATCCAVGEAQRAVTTRSWYTQQPSLVTVRLSGGPWAHPRHSPAACGCPHLRPGQLPHCP